MRRTQDVKANRTPSKTAVLIVGRGGHLQRSLEIRLNQAGCEVSTAPDGPQAIQRAQDAAPDLVMLGYDMPAGDCLEVCRQFRDLPRTRRTPVLLLPPTDESNGTQATASDTWDVIDQHWRDVQRGMNALLSLDKDGADRGDVISSQGLEMDWRRHRATIDGRTLTLTRTEFRLLWALASDVGKVFDRRLLTKMCGCYGNPRVQIRTIDVHINTIRGKLGDRSSLIETVHGVGYRFREPRVS
jgi:two-component system phosphate regulon response regulator PhoB